jgi:hypothetical protein
VKFHQLFYLFLVIILAYSCGSKTDQKWRRIRLYPNDNSQMITIITIDNDRYFIDGEHYTVPNYGFIKVDISSVDQLGDAVAVCWNESGYKWKVSSTYGTLIETKLDTSKFKYYQPVGIYGEPVSTGYTGELCGAKLIRENLKGRGNINIDYYSDK